MRTASPVGGDRHEPQQQRAQQAALCFGQRLVERFGGVGDGAADPAGLPIAIDGEGAALAALPGLAQGVRQQRQRARLTLHVMHEDVHQARLQDQAGGAGRALDRRPQFIVAHRPQQIQAHLDEPGEAGVLGEITEPVGPHRHDHRLAGGVGGDRIEERRPLEGVRAQHGRFLALIDHQHTVRLDLGERRTSGGFPV